ncbi:hypothetical protein [Streptomyces sp. NBC_00096]
MPQSDDCEDQPDLVINTLGGQEDTQDAQDCAEPAPQTAPRGLMDQGQM